MGVIRDSFIFFKSFHEATKDLPADLYKEVMVAFATYALDGEYPEMSATCKGFLMLAKPNIDNANARYLASVENGKRGGNPNLQKGKPNPYYGKKGNSADNPKITQGITQDNLDQKQDNPRDNLNVDVNVDVNVNDIYTHTNAPARTREYLESVKELCKQHCPVIYNRHMKNPKADLNIGLTIEEVEQRYTLEEIEAILKHANKTYIVKPKMQRLDLCWVLNSLENVKNIPAEDDSGQGGGNNQNSGGDIAEDKYNGLGKEMHERLYKGVKRL